MKTNNGRKIMLKIILRNIDRTNYITYGLSMALFSLIIYIMASLIQINDIIKLGADSENLRIVFAFYYLVIVCVGVFFIFYALNYYIKSRMRDYGILIALGISRGRALLYLVLEFFLIYITGVLFGIVIGMIVVEIISKIFCISGVTVVLQSTDIINNIKISFLLSIGIFVLGAFSGLFSFLKKDLSRIMSIGVRKENRYHWMCILIILGIVLLYISLESLKNPSFGVILLSLIENFIGMYILLTFGLSIFISFLHRHIKGIYVKYLLDIAGFVYRYRSNKMIVFITYILNIVIIFFAGGMIITSYLDVVGNESTTVVLISSYFVATFTIICNIGILSIKQMYESSIKREWLEKLRCLGMEYKERKKKAVAEFKILVMMPALLSNFFVWFYILAECKRVELIDKGHIISFIIFQVVLVSIQLVYYSIIKYNLKKGVTNR